MKLGPYLLINVLLIGGALYIYDSLRPAPRRDSSANRPAYDPLTADDLSTGSSEYDPAPALLDGGGSETLLRGMQARIQSLEAEQRRLKAALAGGGGSGDGSAGSEGGGTAMPAISIDDVGDIENPVFDERALSSIEAYVDEINRRKNEIRQRERIINQLDRLEMEITEAQETAVVDATMDYQREAAKLYSISWPRTEEARDARRKAFEDLQDRFVRQVNSLVPITEAQKIINSRVARARGFVTGEYPRNEGRNARRAGKDGGR